MKIAKLNTRGFAHTLVPVFVVVIIAIGGAAYLVASHADSCPPASGISDTSSVSGSCTNPASGTSGVSAPSDGRKYSALLSQTRYGKVFACFTASTVYMRVVTNNATKLAYSYSNGTTANLNVPAESTVYRHVNAYGTTIAAQVSNKGLKATTVAPWKLTQLPACN